MVETTAEQTGYEQLIERLRDYRLRSEARQALMATGEEAAPHVLEALQRPGFPLNMYWACMTILGALKYEPAVDTILEFLRDNENLKGEATRTLQEITGWNIGESYEDWRKALSGESDAEKTAGVEGQDTSSAETKPGEESWLTFVKEALGDTASEISEESEHIYTDLTFNDRHQQLILQFADEKTKEDEPAVLLYTESGSGERDTLQKLMEKYNSQLTYGRTEIVESTQSALSISVKYYCPLQDLTKDKLKDIAITMAQDADAIERELTGQDRI